MLRLHASKRAFHEALDRERAAAKQIVVCRSPVSGDRFPPGGPHAMYMPPFTCIVSPVM